MQFAARGVKVDRTRGGQRDVADVGRQRLDDNEREANIIVVDSHGAIRTYAICGIAPAGLQYVSATSESSFANKSVAAGRVFAVCARNMLASGEAADLGQAKDG